jgi:hypothetical protein
MNNANFEPDEKIILKAKVPTVPEDTTITSSYWEIYYADPNKKAALVHVMDESGNFGGSAYGGSTDGEGGGSDLGTLVLPPGRLPKGEYAARGRFNTLRDGEEGTTQWTEFFIFTIQDIASRTGGGGCDVGLGFFAAGFAALAYLLRKGRGAK